MQIGVSIRHAPHAFVEQALQSPVVDFVEIAAEEFLFRKDAGSQGRLKKILSSKSVSVHSYSLSLLDPQPWNEKHVGPFFEFIRSHPFLCASDHYAISSWKGRHLGSLTPAPVGPEANELLKLRLARIHRELRSKPFFLENPAAPFHFASTGPASFVDHLPQALAETHTQLLLDISNLVANELNFGVVAEAELERLQDVPIGEIHLAGGHWVNAFFLDSHSTEVAPRSLELLERLMPRLSEGTLVLIEREQNHPSWELLEQEIENVSRICRV